MPLIITLCLTLAPFGFSASQPNLPEVTQPASTADISHWAFQPVHRSSPPPASNPDWIQNPVDAFVLAKLDEHEMAPAPPADKYTLIRRATFDLIGLPPTPEEIEAFVHDESPEAYAHLIDRLLASPHYGERWGRYWLDLVRYADTNGVDENYSFRNAWRYRDYVIHSFNQDKSYARFTAEQLAGDLLPATRDLERQRDRITATGMLALGPKMLAEQDKDKMLIDIVDEQIDVISKTFMGITVSCARCHDHKFDPIPTEDYYALAGIFVSTKSMANTNHVSFWVETELPFPENEQIKREHQEKIATLSEEIETLETKEGTKESKKELKSKRDALKQLQADGPSLPTAMSVRDGLPRDLPVHIRGSHRRLSRTPTPRGFLSVIDPSLTPPTVGATSSGRLELARWLTDPNHPLTARVMVNRIWQSHFGQGLVRSPSNFGQRGDAPTHPRLLDWLAAEFVRSDWSIKTVHSIIMLSNSYQMASRHHPAYAETDSENPLLWRQNRRRLEAEPIRDALLAVAENLNGRIAGTVDGADRSPTYYRGSDRVYESPRRAIYIPVVRNRVYDFFATFDYAEAGMHLGRRSSTTVPHQALFMLNNPLVMEQAEALARIANLDQQMTNVQKINDLYLRLFARPARTDEIQKTLEYLRQAESTLSDVSAPSDAENVSPPNAWAHLCHVLLASNEFLFVN